MIDVPESTHGTCCIMSLDNKMYRRYLQSTWCTIVEPVLNRPCSGAGALTVLLAAVLHPGELGPRQMAPSTRSRYRVVGRQVAGGVPPRLVSALRHAFSTYYSLLQLHTEARWFEITTLLSTDEGSTAGGDGWQ